MWWSIVLTILIVVFWIVVPLLLEYRAERKEKENIKKKENEDNDN